MKETMEDARKLSRTRPQPQIPTSARNLPAPMPNPHFGRGADAGISRGEGEYLSLESVLEMLWRQRKVLVSCLLAGLALAGILYKAQPKMYQARVTMEVQLPNDDYMNHRQLDPSIEPGAQMMEPYLQTQLRLVQSDTILGRAAEKIKLAENREFLPADPWWKKFV